MVHDYKSHSGLRQEEPLEKHSAILRDEVFSVIHMQHGNVSRSRKTKISSEFSEDEAFESYHLPEVLDMLITGSGHGHKVAFRSPVVRPRSVSSTPYFIHQPGSFNLSGIPNFETSGKDMDSEAEGRPKTPHHKIRGTRNDASITLHSLQLMAGEFREICKPKIQKLKGGYSATAMLVFNSWLKDVEMCVKEHKLTNPEAVQLVKDYTSEGARGTVEFYLDTNSTCNYED